MEEVIETIPVTDAKGDELIVYEYQKFVRTDGARAAAWWRASADVGYR